MKLIYKLPVGKKSLIEFTPHSLSSFDETKNNLATKEILKQINLFFSCYKTTPPIKYLVFINSYQFNADDIQKAIKFLAHHDWFSVVKEKRIFSSSIKQKFSKAFYHHCKEFTAK